MATRRYDRDGRRFSGDEGSSHSNILHTSTDSSPAQHEDAHRLVHKIATAAGAKLLYGTTVVKVAPGNSGPSVTLATGEVLTADIVIGADGSHSFVRRTVFDYEDDAKPSGTTVFGGIIPETEMMKYPDLAKMLKSPEVSLALRVLCFCPLIYDILSGRCSWEPTAASVVSPTSLWKLQVTTLISLK